MLVTFLPYNTPLYGHGEMFLGIGVYHGISERFASQYKVDPQRILDISGELKLGLSWAYKVNLDFFAGIQGKLFPDNAIDKVKESCDDEWGEGYGGVEISISLPFITPLSTGDLFYKISPNFGGISEEFTRHTSVNDSEDFKETYGCANLWPEISLILNVEDYLYEKEICQVEFIYEYHDLGNIAIQEHSSGNIYYEKLNSHKIFLCFNSPVIRDKSREKDFTRSGFYTSLAYKSDGRPLDIFMGWRFKGFVGFDYSKPVRTKYF